MADLMEQIAATMHGLNDAWKSNDGSAVAAFFTDDGTLINPFGQRADGRAAVAAMYTQYFTGMLRGTSSTATLRSVRAIEANHAFVDADQTILAADGSVAIAVHIAALLRRDGGVWRFADARPYVVATAPAA